MESGQGGPAIRCDACGTERGPLMKLSLGKDFFGRAYDRLSPAADQSPKWYCETCSMHKNLQRDFRDIKAELDKLASAQASELAAADQLQRAQLRLCEIRTILESSQRASRLLDSAEVAALISRIQAHKDFLSVPH
ncbi:hypothetical protein [Nitrospira sp. Kam-Ns4a]